MSDDTPDGFLPQTVSYLGFIAGQLRNLRGIATLTYELVQNADDVHDEDGRPGAQQIMFDVRDDVLIVENDGVFRDRDFERMQNIASGGKREEAGTTGAFGIGFISVYQITDNPEILSGGMRLQFRPDAQDEKHRIARWIVQTQATQFRLPWAFKDSSIRRALSMESVQRDRLDLFANKIAEALTLAALFLKQLTTLEVKRSGRLIKHIERRIIGPNQIEIHTRTSTSSQVAHWHTFRGDFKAEEVILRRESGTQIEAKRHSRVQLFIPDKFMEQSGRLFAVLPSETLIPLPFHIDADFYPTPDRKRILFEGDIQSKWNRAAIRASARILAKAFIQLPALLGHKGFWHLLSQLDKCRQQAEKGDMDSVFGSYWEEVAPLLKEQPIVYTTTGGWDRPSKARVLETEAELAAAEILTDLGIHIAHPDLRPFYNILRNSTVDTPLLDVHDVVDGLRTKGLTGQRCLLASAPASLRTKADWELLWQALQARLPRYKPAERTIVERALCDCAIAFGIDGALWPPAKLFRGDAETRQLFEVPWLDTETQAGSLPENLVAEFKVIHAKALLNGIVDQKLKGTGGQHSSWLKDLYHWLEKRRDEILANPQLKAEIIALRIWPTATGEFHPLSDLYIATGFEDPLKLSTLVDLSALGGRKEFLQDLGVKELTFETYVRSRLPRVFKDTQQLSLVIRQQLAEVLAQKLGEMQSMADLQRIMQDLPLVECRDSRFLKGREVYADSEAVNILGPGVAVAIAKTDAMRALYEWLGVAQQPRPEDLVKRVRDIVFQPPNNARRDAIVLIFEYLTNQWHKWSQTERERYASLQHIAWLPTINQDAKTTWERPGSAYATFQSHLFKTEALFLDLPRPLQDTASAVGLLKFLGVNLTPNPIQVVKYLTRFAKRGEPVSDDVYRYLNDNADDPALDALIDIDCLFLRDKGRYVRPQAVFWGKHPFGRFRDQLGQKLQVYQALFERLKVREHPHDQDYIQVLIDISEEFGSRNANLDDEAQAVLLHCWEIVSSALETHGTTNLDLSPLRDRKVILGPRKLLALPKNIFFEDRPGLAAKFPQFLENDVIPRPQDAWRAMEAVGVRPLSQAVHVNLIECDNLTLDNMILTRLKERRMFIERVVGSNSTNSAERMDVAILDRLQVKKATRLVIGYDLELFRQKRQTKPEHVYAQLFREGEEAVIYAVYGPDGVPQWAAVARELAYAIKPQGEIGGLASGLKEILAGSSVSQVNLSLNELGYPLVSLRLPMVAQNHDPVVGLGSVLDTMQDQLSNDRAPQTVLAETESGHSVVSPAIHEKPAAPDWPHIKQDSGIDQHAEQQATSPGSAVGIAGASKNKSRSQSRLRTYVAPEDKELDPTDEDSSIDTEAEAAHRSAVDQAGVRCVLAYEQRCQRTPIEMPHHHAGYDIESRDASEAIRYIEVKSLSGDWGAHSAAGLTRRQFKTARELGLSFWLYVVERAESDDPKIHRIQDPANRVNQYLFDDGWTDLAEGD